MSEIKLRKEPGRQVKIYFQRLLLPPPSPVLANTHSIVLPVNRAAACLYNVPRTQDVGPPTQFRLNVRSAS